MKLAYSCIKAGLRVCECIVSLDMLTLSLSERLLISDCFSLTVLNVAHHNTVLFYLYQNTLPKSRKVVFVLFFKSVISLLQTESAWAEEYLEKKRSSHKRSASWGSTDQLKEVRSAII